MPKAWYSRSAQPAPIPIAARPFDRWSSVVIALASTAGWR